MTVGEKIRTLRNDQGLTQKELGEACGIAESTIRRYELGRLNPKYETRKRIADALGVPVFQLLPDDAQLTMGPVQKQFNKSIMRRFLTVK